MLKPCRVQDIEQRRVGSAAALKFVENDIGGNAAGRLSAVTGSQPSVAVVVPYVRAKVLAVGRGLH